MARLGRGRMVVAVALVALLTVTMARPAAAEEEEGNFGRDFGMGVGAVFTNILYMPAKFMYATFGSITGGFAYLLTGLNLNIAKEVWVPSMGGTYVVTPSMLKGEDKIMWSGTTEAKHHAGHSEEDLPDAKSDGDGKAY